MKTLLRTILPSDARRVLRWKLNQAIRQLKQPRMLWGYMDSTGQWRERTRVSDSAVLYHAQRVHLAENVFVGHFVILDGTASITINEGTQLSARSTVLTHSSETAIRLYGEHYTEIPEHKRKGFYALPVHIGRYVFVGIGATILPGVTVGDGALVAAGAIVRESVPPFAIVVGMPARIVGDTRERDHPFLKDMQLKHWYDAWQQVR